MLIRIIYCVEWINSELYKLPEVGESSHFVRKIPPITMEKQYSSNKMLYLSHLLKLSEMRGTFHVEKGSPVPLETLRDERRFKILVPA